MKKLPIVGIVLAIIAWTAGVRADVLPNNRHIFINVANSSGVKYDVDGPAFGGPSNTYYINSGGGGLNELGISETSDTTKMNVVKTLSTSSPSGTFYVTNSGGRGFDDNIILLVSVRGPLTSNFSLTVTSHGYTWTPAATGVYTPSAPTDYTYTGGMSQTFHASDFKYGPQAYKPGPGGDGVTPSWSLPLYNGEQPTGNDDPANVEYLMFVDLYAGNLKSDVTAGLINNGAVRVDFQFTGLYSTAVFNGYGWVSASNQGQGINFTNFTSTSSAASGVNGYSIFYSGPAPSPSDITANPTSLGFGSVVVNEPSNARVLAMTNAGELACTVGAVNVTGVHASEFAIAPGTDTCSGNVLEGGATCTVGVVFSPASTGSREATLNIPSDASNSTNLAVSLTGTGVTGISVTPSSLDFGGVDTGGSKNLDLAIANDGTANLTITSVRLTGDSSFRLGQTLDGTTISSGSQVILPVEFAPTTSGDSSATVTINSDNPLRPVVVVSLTGTTTPTAHLTAAPAGPIVYQAHDVAQTTGYETRTVTVTSDGNYELRIGEVSLGNTTDYTVTSDTCSGRTMPSGSCDISVRFNPGAAGTRTGSLIIPSNSGNADGTIDRDSTVQLTGTGIRYGVELSPRTLDFGTILLPDNNQAGNTPSGCTDYQDGTVRCPVTITNTGSTAISSVTLFTGNGPFTASPSALSSLQPGGTAAVEVIYAATSGANDSDTGTLTADTGYDSDSITLTGMTNTRPATPVNQHPAEATTVSTTPTLTASVFSDPDGDTQEYAAWQIATDSQFKTETVVFSPVVSDPLNFSSLTVPTGVLQQGTTYYWRVSHLDRRGATSLPSAITSFATAAGAMNQGGTAPLGMTATTSTGDEVTSLSDLSAGVAAGNVSARLLADLGSSAVINSGTLFDGNSRSPTVALVRENGGSSSAVLGIVTPAGTNIVTATTTTTTDASFSTSPPEGFSFPAGVVSFGITGVAGANNPVRVTLYAPADLPDDAVWYKYTTNYGWLRINRNGTYDATGSALLSTGTRFNVVNGKGVLTITDNDITDSNPQQGVVSDPGAPAVPSAVTLTPIPENPGPGGGGGGCFIATAAFGSYLSPYVEILRSFRDRFLLTTRAGGSFVRWYYRVSPPIARTIAGSEGLRAGVRIALVPIIAFGALCLKIGVLPALVSSILLLMILVALPVAAVRRISRGRSGGVRPV